MNRYQNQTPRAAFAIAAFAMSVLTMAVTVGAPAAAGAGTANGSVLAREGAVQVSHIEVIGHRAENLKLADARMPHVDQ